MREWGKAMRTARQEKGLTMQELADKSGVSMWSIHDYERHNHEPRLYNLVCLADALGVTLDEYIGRETPRREESEELTGREKLIAELQELADMLPPICDRDRPTTINVFDAPVTVYCKPFEQFQDVLRRAADALTAAGEPAQKED